MRLVPLVRTQAAPGIQRVALPQLFPKPKPEKVASKVNHSVYGCPFFRVGLKEKHKEATHLGGVQTPYFDTKTGASFMRRLKRLMFRGIHKA